jgi:hypothetical protein
MSKLVCDFDTGLHMCIYKSRDVMWGINLYIIGMHAVMHEVHILVIPIIKSCEFYTQISIGLQAYK